MRAAALLALLPGFLSLAAVAQDPHAGHQGHEANPKATTETRTALSLPVGDAPPPPVIRDNAADRVYPVPAMDRARDILAKEHGGARLSKVMADVLELTATSGDAGHRWDLEAWYGGDRHRFVLATEGDAPGGDVNSAETQALYSRAVGRYTDLRGGVRYEFEPEGVAYATIGFETLLPYWFDLEGALSFSEHGDTFARLEGSYDVRFTQRLILQPRVELTLSAQDVPGSRVGSGFSEAEIGLRLRYDIRREIAPYIGVNFEKSFGRTADLVRASGDETHDTAVVVGLRAWF